MVCFVSICVAVGALYAFSRTEGGNHDGHFNLTVHQRVALINCVDAYVHSDLLCVILRYHQGWLRARKKKKKKGTLDESSTVNLSLILFLLCYSCLCGQRR